MTVLGWAAEDGDEKGRAGVHSVTWCGIGSLLLALRSYLVGSELWQAPDGGKVGLRLWSAEVFFCAYGCGPEVEAVGFCASGALISYRHDRCARRIAFCGSGVA